jgi:hypothetical protein
VFCVQNELKERSHFNAMRGLNIASKMLAAAETEIVQLQAAVRSSITPTELTLCLAQRIDRLTNKVESLTVRCLHKLLDLSFST